MIVAFRCYEGIVVKVKDRIFVGSTVCVASCYSFVWGETHRAFNKVRFASGWFGDNRISLRDGKVIHQRKGDRDRQDLSGRAEPRGEHPIVNRFFDSFSCGEKGFCE